MKVDRLSSKNLSQKLKKKHRLFTYYMPLCICTSGRTRLRTLIVCLKLLCLDTSQYEIAQTKAVSKHENLISWLPHRPDFHFGTQASFSSNLCMPNLKECFGSTCAVTAKTLSHTYETIKINSQNMCLRPYFQVGSISIFTITTETDVLYYIYNIL